MSEYRKEAEGRRCCGEKEEDPKRGGPKVVMIGPLGKQLGKGSQVDGVAMDLPVLRSWNL